MKFKPFKMAQFSGQWPAGTLTNMHSSNPQPWGWEELSNLLGHDVLSMLRDTPLAYESVQGHPGVRNNISHHYHSQVNPEHVVLTSGAQEGIFLLMHALLQPGDQVITFSPCFEPLTQVAIDAGAAVTTLPLIEETGWHIDWDLLNQTITDQTQLVVINFPHNPTGAHITEADLQRLISLCEQHDCWLFSDEVFRGLEHQPEDRISCAADLYPKAVSMGVVSKALALPGIRLGWLASQNQALIKQLLTVKSHLSICQSSLDAQLCDALIPHSEQLWQRSIAIINENKSYLNESLQNHDWLSWHAPQASATAFIQYRGGDILSAITAVAESMQLLLLPNEVFLTDHPGFRLTLGADAMEDKYEALIHSPLWSTHA